MENSDLVLQTDSLLPDDKTGSSARKNLKNPPIVVALFQVKYSAKDGRLEDFLKYDEQIKRHLPIRSDNLQIGIDLGRTSVPLGMSKFTETTDAQIDGYSVCEICDFDPKYKKIVLYVKTNSTECTHAARELRNGFWSSKLGRYVDIQHGTPYTIESKVYGEVYCFMRKEFD
jgi:hypothetical protein